MKLIAETKDQPVRLIVCGDFIGELSMDIAVWLDHHGWQSGIGTLLGDESLIAAALEEVDVEVSYAGQRFDIIIDHVLAAQRARFALLGEVPESLLGAWRAV